MTKAAWDCAYNSCHIISTRTGSCLFSF